MELSRAIINIIVKNNQVTVPFIDDSRLASVAKQGHSTKYINIKLNLNISVCIVQSHIE